MAHPHPSVWIIDFLERNGLTLDHVAAGMVDAAGDDVENSAARDREWGVMRLALDLYVECGPGDPSIHLGEMAAALDRAFERAPGFFAELERKWIDGGHSMEGVRS